jgi:nitronate monooxygenase
MPIRTRLTESLRITHPVLLAPMDGVADARLASAVSAAGGLGILGGGYAKSEEWLSRELDRLAESGSRFAVGFITWSMAQRPKLLDLALERKPAAIMLSFGDPRPFFEKIAGCGVPLICQVQTLAMAKEAVAAGAKILVAQGAEAGGHGLSRGTIALVPEVVDAVGSEVPVVAAGGIADGRGLAAALMLGASGVLMGTRFYATEEAATPQKTKERVRAVTGDDSLRSIVFDVARRNVWPEQFTGRCLRNSYADRWFGREAELRANEPELVRFSAARDEENFDVAAVIAGEASGLVRDVCAAGEVVERTVRGAEALLARASALIGGERAGASS